MKITKRQLRQIIREERGRLAEQTRHAWRGFRGAEFGFHDVNYLFDFLSDEVENYLDAAQEPGLTAEDLRNMRSALMAAADRIEAEFGVKA